MKDEKCYKILSLYLTTFNCILAPSVAKADAFVVSLGGVYNSDAVKGDGALLGSLAPLTPFRTKEDKDSAGIAATLGYDFNVGRAFVGIEAGAQLASSRQSITATSAVIATQTVIRCFPQAPAPDGPPPSCVNGPATRTTTTFNETQLLNVKVKSGPSISLVAHAGFDLGRTRLFVSGGVISRYRRVSYELPEVATAIPFQYPVVDGEIGRPVPFEAEPITLPAESRNTLKCLWGWTAGAGVERSLGERLSVRLRYEYSDLGTANFVETARLARMTIGSTTHSVSTAFALNF